jgi:hypothetical protein
MRDPLEKTEAMTRYRSPAFRLAWRAIATLHASGKVDDATMTRFDELCLTPQYLKRREAVRKMVAESDQMKTAREVTAENREALGELAKK